VHEKRIAVAGFAPFGAHAENPSERVVRALAGEPGLATAVLPVAYRRAESQLVATLESVRPDALLLLGRHEGEAIRLERVALNLNDAASPDEDGERRNGTPILPAGPVGHWSTLPLEAFAAALASRALPVVWSRDAGGFLCNHVFYVARHWVEQSGRRIPCGLVHLPPLEALALERQVEGVRTCLALLSAYRSGS
jgi:pyroglutamyl-peptidase